MSDEERLTATEIAVARLMAEGADTRTITARLQLSSAEVRRVTKAVYAKLRVRSRLEAAERVAPQILEAQHDHTESMTRRPLLVHLRKQHPAGFEHSRSGVLRLEDLHSSLHHRRWPS